MMKASMMGFGGRVGLSGVSSDQFVLIAALD